MQREQEKKEIKDDSYIRGLCSCMEGAISWDKGDRRRNGLIGRKNK